MMKVVVPSFGPHMVCTKTLSRLLTPLRPAKSRIPSTSARAVGADAGATIATTNTIARGRTIIPAWVPRGTGSGPAACKLDCYAAEISKHAHLQGPSQHRPTHEGGGKRPIWSFLPTPSRCRIIAGLSGILDLDPVPRPGGSRSVAIGLVEPRSGEVHGASPSLLLEQRGAPSFATRGIMKLSMLGVIGRPRPHWGAAPVLAAWQRSSLSAMLRRGLARPHGEPSLDCPGSGTSRRSGRWRPAPSTNSSCWTISHGGGKCRA